MSGIRSGAGVALFAALLSACAPGSGLVNVRGEPVPTAAFVFFDKDAVTPQEGSDATIREAAAYLVQYENTVAKIVGHVARDEALSSDPNQRLDRLRASSIGSTLMQLGVAPERIQPGTAGRTENMAQSGDDASIDRRVDILFGVQ